LRADVTGRTGAVGRWVQATARRISSRENSVVGDAPHAPQSDVWMEDRTTRVRASSRLTVKVLPCGSISSSR
jgi:hypothetical protein